ncbi:MAG: ArsS family sensor histidine kinase [Epsilonproteobacteria bacterium]|nr:ArsS family sensor histidine kinase [Campylobacterota bacterium]
MNRHSLLFYITLFFIFLMIVINTLFFIQYRLESHKAKEDLFKRFHDSERVLHMSRRDHLPFEEAKKRLYNLMYVELLRKDEVKDLSDATLIEQRKAIKIYEKDTKIYFLFDDKRRDKKLYMRYTNYQPQSNSPLLIAFFINLAVFLFYLYVLKRLHPLKILKLKIARFAEGDMDIISDVKGKDEIAEVSREFNHAIEKIQTLQDSRKLFLRNIMHELKTPIAKGKLITDLMDDTKNQERLKRIFTRFEYLLGEFTKIERVTSNVMVLNRKKYRVIDILDNAFDILLLELDVVDIEVMYHLEIEADYEFISIALKNLVDNAIKYGKGRAKIIIKKEQIIVQSSGEKLNNINFNKVFNRIYEGSEKGLGLGLYITKNILEKHGYLFDYQHEQGKNNFIIQI